MQRIEPYPDELQLAAYYDDDYRDSEDFAEAGFAVSHRRRFAPEYRGTVNAEYRQSIADLGLALDPDQRILDYGCADGVFLDYLAGEGHDATRLTGVDVSPQMVAVVADKGYHAHTSDTYDPAREGPYDLITLWDVIEHVPSPVETLTELARGLATNGHILIQTPRIGTLAAHLGQRFEHYLPIEHLHLFPRDTLEAAAKRAGLRTTAACSFGANAPEGHVPQPYKAAYDALAKATDNGATQLMLLAR